MIVQGLAAFTLVATAGSIVCRVLLNATAGRAAKSASQVGLNAAGIDLTLPPVEVPSAGAAEGEPVAEVSRSDES